MNVDMSPGVPFKIILVNESIQGGTWCWSLRLQTFLLVLSK